MLSIMPEIRAQFVDALAVMVWQFFATCISLGFSEGISQQVYFCLRKSPEAMKYDSKYYWFTSAVGLKCNFQLFYY